MTDRLSAPDVFDGHAPSRGVPPPPDDLPFDPQRALASLNDRVLDLARERPALALVSALAAGFLLGKLVARL